MTEREEGETDVDDSIHLRRNKSKDKEARLEELIKSLRRGRRTEVSSQTFEGDIRRVSGIGSGERRESEVRDRERRRQGLRFTKRVQSCSMPPRSRRSRERNEEKEIEVRKLQMERIAKNINNKKSGRKCNLIANEKQFVFTS